MAGVEPRPPDSQPRAPVAATGNDLTSTRVVLDSEETVQPLCDLGHVTSPGFGDLILEARAGHEELRFPHPGL